MYKKALIVLALFLSFQVFGWGVTGHRTIGELADHHLSKKARKKLKSVLGHDTPAVLSTWMDQIRSYDEYDHTYDWHWVTIPDGETYEGSEKNPKGDVIMTIERLISELKAGGLTKDKEAEHIKMLIHLIGDIHQPLHVGTGGDRGGNDEKVVWFREESNLHRVWDSGMIEARKYSYTELTSTLDHVSKEQVKQWQSASVRDWARESISLRKQVYDLPEDNTISYRYLEDNWKTVELRLTQAGIRLAGILNEIYG